MTYRTVDRGWKWMALGVLALSVGCAQAEVDPGKPVNGGGGTGGSVAPAGLPGLTSLSIEPTTQMITLTRDAAGKLAGMASYKATGKFQDGRSEDVTGKVSWGVDTLGSRAFQGTVTVDSPGRHGITARSGAAQAAAELIASFKGDFFGAGVDSALAPKLEGTAAGAGATIVYPIDNSLFPGNFGPITVQIQKPGAQDVARLHFVGEGLDVQYFGKCEPGPGNGCYVTLPVEFTRLLVAPSERMNVQLTARLGASAGGALVETPPVSVAWAGLQLSGGLYYWTTMLAQGKYTPPQQAATGTGIMRYDFSGTSSQPELVYTDKGAPPQFAGSPTAGDGSTCIGCHAISHDGKLMALSIGGSNWSDLAVLDIAGKSLWSVNPTGSNALDKQRRESVATFTTWGPSDDRIVNMYRGQLFLRTVAGGAVGDMGRVVPTVKELATDPFWSEDGRFFAFTTFADPLAAAGVYNTMGTNADTKTGGQIWVATGDATKVNDDAQIIVPREAGVTSYYPAISSDGEYIVFNRSKCGSGIDANKTASDYGNQTCDGYDDLSASLWLTTPQGKLTTPLTRANGPDGSGNSWPRWSPDSGNFRGGKLYWVAFSSRRPYGLQVNTGAAAATKPQLWFAGVLVGAESASDPSFAPVWLPNQNPNQAMPNGNHVPQWVRFAVVIN